MRYALSLLLLSVCAHDTAAQSAVLRVTASDAVVRSMPKEDASAVATPPIASMLEVAKAEGDWYMVLLPADAQGLRRYGYIHRRSVEAMAVPAEKPGREGGQPSPPSTSAPDPTAIPLAADWQARFRAAEARRSGGRAKKWAGIGMQIGGAALVATFLAKGIKGGTGANAECSSANACYEYAWGIGGGVGLAVTGAILKSRGRKQLAAAEQEIIQLKTELANARPRAHMTPPAFGSEQQGLVIRFRAGSLQQ